MAFFSEISDLFSTVLRLVPRIFLVNPDEAGVRVTLGTRITEMKPGWYIHWPLIQDCEAIKTRTQIKDLRAQSVWTADRQEMTVSGAIRYRVKDARKAILEVFDYDANVQALALGIIQRYVGHCNLDSLDRGDLEKEIIKGLREESQGWGLRIEFVYITDIGRTQNFRVLLNEPIISVES